MLPVPAAHLPHAHVGVVDRDVAARREGEAEQLARDPEHRLAQALELQVGLHLVLVEVVLRLAHLLGVVAVVPRLDADARRPSRRRAPACRRPPRPRARARPATPSPSAPSPLGRLRHVALEPPVRVGGEAEQPRPLGAQPQDLGDDGLVVVRAAVVAARHELGPHLLAQLAVGGGGEERLHDERVLRIAHWPACPRSRAAAAAASRCGAASPSRSASRSISV